MQIKYILQLHTVLVLCLTFLELFSTRAVQAIPDTEAIKNLEISADTNPPPTQQFTGTTLGSKIDYLDQVQPISDSELEEIYTSEDEVLRQIDEYSFEENLDENYLDPVSEKYLEPVDENYLEQVTDVNQLRDIDPFWFEALDEMVSKYGCLVGYPDNTYRGERPITRYEMAAALSLCMENIEKFLAEGRNDIQKEDLDSLKTLQEQLAMMMADHRTGIELLDRRIQELEGRITTLEGSQFSVTTKLSGEVIFALSDLAIDQTPRLLPRGTLNGFPLVGLTDNDDANLVFGGRGRLWLRTSFNGEDQLLLRATVSNLPMFDDANELTGRNIPNLESLTGETTQTFNIGFNTPTFQTNNFTASYSLPLGDVVHTHIFAAGGIWSDFVPTLNPYFEDYDGGNGALSTFASSNPIYRIGGGSGIGFNFNLDFLESFLGSSRLSVGYLASSRIVNNLSVDGLFGGDYAVLAQLDFQLSDRLALGLTYNHGYHPSNTAVFDMGGLGSQGVVGSAISNTAASGMTIPKITNAYGVEMAWQVVDAVSLSGFFTYIDAHAPAVQPGDYEIWTYGVGLAFPDLFKEGGLLGIFGGTQPYVAGFDSDTATIRNNILPRHLEIFYRYPINKRISLTPGIIFFTSPNQIRAGGSIATLRATFSF